ncbi:unnamed protein product [Paramecium primaurelia]|uniref:Transmembrane protein n=2 Tax=Paramecium TaxID=5884 RepID=A0A8S1U3S6_9CILI|nr:unnamed protein product [Paramecium primaurelia]CAD8158733.1 unnamed protein product [Paramecium pentaurelia]
MNEDEIKQMVEKYKLRKENFDSYKPNKKYYFENSDELFVKAQIKEQQTFLKSFNHYQDLPRASVNILGARRQWEFASGYFFVTIPASYIIGRILANEKYGIYNANHRIRRMRIYTYFSFVLIGFIYIPTIPVFTPQNSGIFQPQFYEKKVQRDLDLSLNLYQNVDTIINKDQEPSWEDYKKILRNVQKKTLMNVKV